MPSSSTTPCRRARVDAVAPRERVVQRVAAADDDAAEAVRQEDHDQQPGDRERGLADHAHADQGREADDQQRADERAEGAGGRRHGQRDDVDAGVGRERVDGELRLAVADHDAAEAGEDAGDRVQLELPHPVRHGERAGGVLVVAQRLHDPAEAAVPQVVGQPHSPMHEEQQREQVVVDGVVERVVRPRSASPGRRRRRGRGPGAAARPWSPTRRPASRRRARDPSAAGPGCRPGPRRAPPRCTPQSTPKRKLPVESATWTDAAAAMPANANWPRESWPATPVSRPTLRPTRVKPATSGQHRGGVVADDGRRAPTATAMPTATQTRGSQTMLRSCAVRRSGSGGSTTRRQRPLSWPDAAELRAGAAARRR